VTKYLPYEKSVVRSIVTDCLVIREVTYWRDFLRQVKLLRESHFALLERALQVDILDLVAEVRLLIDQADQAIPDLQENLGALVDGLAEGTRSVDGEGFTTAPEGELAESLYLVMIIKDCKEMPCSRRDIRDGRVGRKVNRVYLQDVLGRVRTVGQRVASIDL